MGADDRAGALAVDVEVADEELALGPFDLLGIPGVDRSGQSVLGAVGDPQRLVVALGRDDREHRAEDLLLGDGGVGPHVGDHGGLDEVTLLAGHRAAAGDQAPFLLAGLDVGRDLVARRGVHHRAHGDAGLLGLADRDLGDQRLQLLDEGFVDLLAHHRARAGGALLPLESERGGRHALGSGVEIGFLVHDDGVFTAHLRDHALEPDLPGLHLGRQPVDANAHLLGAGERHEPGLRVPHDRVAHGRAAARDEVDDARRQADLLHQLEELPGDGR